MPELPEVQTVVNSLAGRVVGQRIARVQVLRADIVHPAETALPALLEGQRIAALTRRGKKIVFTLANGHSFYIHLGMSGRLTIEPPATALLPHTHLIFTIAGAHIHFRDPRRFGGFYWLGSDLSHETNLGPEPLLITSTILFSRLARTRRPIKSALLDQSLIAGLGNIYVDEALFDSHIHPQTLAHTLTRLQVQRLTRSIKKILKRAIKHKGSTLRDYRDADGKPGNFQSLHRVYHRTGHPCPVCRTPIEKLTVAGRSTHVCLNCQKI